MVKLSVLELEQLLQFMKSRSTDTHFKLRLDPHSAIITFSSVDNEVISVELFDESIGSFAKAYSVERLSQLVSKKK